MDGKTRVREHIAELTVRGELNNDNEDGTTLKPISSGTSITSTRNRISKKEKRAQQVSWKKRRRQAEAIERAENLKEMLDKKVSNSMSKLKNITERRKPWEEYNKNVIAPLTKGGADKSKKKSNNVFDLLDNEDDNDWEDDNDTEKKEEMDVSD